MQHSPIHTHAGRADPGDVGRAVDLVRGIVGSVKAANERVANGTLGILDGGVAERKVLLRDGTDSGDLTATEGGQERKGDGEGEHYLVR